MPPPGPIRSGAASLATVAGELRRASASRSPSPSALREANKHDAAPPPSGAWDGDSTAVPEDSLPLEPSTEYSSLMDILAEHHAHPHPPPSTFMNPDPRPAIAHPRPYTSTSTSTSKIATRQGGAAHDPATAATATHEDGDPDEKTDPDPHLPRDHRSSAPAPTSRRSGSALDVYAGPGGHKRALVASWAQRDSRDAAASLSGGGGAPHPHPHDDLDLDLDPDPDRSRDQDRSRRRRRRDLSSSDRDGPPRVRSDHDHDHEREQEREQRRGTSTLFPPDTTRRRSFADTRAVLELDAEVIRSQLLDAQRHATTAQQDAERYQRELAELRTAHATLESDHARALAAQTQEWESRVASMRRLASDAQREVTAAAEHVKQTAGQEMDKIRQQLRSVRVKLAAEQKVHAETRAALDAARGDAQGLVEAKQRAVKAERSLADARRLTKHQLEVERTRVAEAEAQVRRTIYKFICKRQYVSSHDAMTRYPSGPCLFFFLSFFS